MEVLLRKLYDYLMRIDQDKYLHLIAGMLIMFILCLVKVEWYGSLIVLIAISFLKEWFDVMRDKDFSYSDMLFTIGGGVFAFLIHLT